MQREPFWKQETSRSLPNQRTKVGKFAVESCRNKKTRKKMSHTWNEEECNAHFQTGSSKVKGASGSSSFVGSAGWEFSLADRDFADYTHFSWDAH